VIWREDREFQSPAPNCEGQGAPSTRFVIVIEIVATCL
jgi:hypothetical protein